MENWKKENLDCLKKAITKWNKNEEGMQGSYPGGLSQFIEEQNFLHSTLCDYIAEILQSKDPDKYQEGYPTLII